jgi:hypothetical protein
MRYTRSFAVTLFVAVCAGQGADLCADQASRIARPARAGEQAFRALYKELVATNNAHGLNERMRVQSLMESRDFLYQLTKMYAGGK